MIDGANWTLRYRFHSIFSIKYGLTSGLLKYSECPLRGAVDLFLARKKGKIEVIKKTHQCTLQQSRQYVFLNGEAIKRQPAVYLGCVKSSFTEG